MPEIFKQKNLVSPEFRRKAVGQKGAVVWFTGLSGSGKSTVACHLEKKLINMGVNAYLLDGDNLRFGLNSDLGFSDADRKENIRRISHVAALMADSSAVAIVSAISPFSADRESARNAAFSFNVPFVEVFVDTSLETCISRDVKGLYKKAIAGEISDFTGISSPYEKPENPEITIKTEECSPEESAGKIAEYVMLLQNTDSMTKQLGEVAKKAGEKIIEIYSSGDFSVDYKDDSSPLTQADIASNDVICSFLKEKYPTYAVLSEESRDNLSRLDNPACFVVDPLDGTKEFVKRNGEFTVNIAFSYYGKSIAGVIYVPVTRELYYAAKGFGAYKMTDESERYFDEKDRITVSDKTDNFVFVASRSHADERLQNLLDKYSDRISQTVSVGSSLKGCLVAKGDADMYYRTGYTMEWDTAAMQCIVEEAGGVFMQLDGTPMRYNRKNSLNDKGFFVLNNIKNKLEL